MCQVTRVNYMYYWIHYDRDDEIQLTSSDLFIIFNITAKHVTVQELFHSKWIIQSTCLNACVVYYSTSIIIDMYL